MSDWIEWNGGECPVARNSPISVRLRDGELSEDQAVFYRWQHEGAHDDIVAYRLVLQTPQDAVQKTGIDATLAERGARYGEFNEHARITQAIKTALTSGRSWASCTPSQKEALEMLAHKMGRIVNGDPTYLDSWVDIIGYTRLVEKELEAAR